MQKSGPRRSAGPIQTADKPFREAWRAAGPPKWIRIARLFPVAQSSRRALTAPTARFAPSQISAFCALAARSPCICSRLQVALPPSVATAHRAGASFRRTFGSLCRLWRQQPTGLALPSGAGRAGSLRPWAQTFLKLLAEKAAAGGLFRQTDGRTLREARRSSRFFRCHCSKAFSSPPSQVTARKA